MFLSLILGGVCVMALCHSLRLCTVSMCNARAWFCLVPAHRAHLSCVIPVFCLPHPSNHLVIQSSCSLLILVPAQPSCALF